MYLKSAATLLSSKLICKIFYIFAAPGAENIFTIKIGDLKHLLGGQAGTAKRNLKQKM